MAGLQTLCVVFAAALVGACQPGSTVPVGDLVPTGPTQAAQVVRVTDGDTIEVTIDGRRVAVRYIGIDAPERSGPFTDPEWLADEAKQANHFLVDGATVHLERDVSDADRFGRLLRYVWLQDGDVWLMVNRELVRLGLAEARTYPPDTRWQTELDEAEDQARADRTGIWGPDSRAPEGLLEIEPARALVGG